MNKTLTPAEKLIVSVIMTRGNWLTVQEVHQALALSEAPAEIQDAAFALWAAATKEVAQ